MVFTNLDSIVRRALLENGRPIHWYPEYLFYGASCLRELSFDSLQIVNTVSLPVNSYSAIDLPSDFVDDVGLFLSASGLLHPVPKKNSLNPLRNRDAEGNFTQYYSGTINQNGLSLYGLGTNWFWFWNVNDWGEQSGRYFGAGGGARNNGYSVVRDRKQIQLTQSFTSDKAILVYISDGQSADSASQIDTQAFATIQAYIEWKSDRDQKGSNFSPKGQMYYNEKRKFRARKDDLTLTDLREIIRKNYIAAPKS